MSSFAECFWNESLQDFTGFEILCRRLRAGKHAWKDYIEFLKHRAHVQESHGKALMKLAKLNGGKDEIGSLRSAWEELYKQTDASGVDNLTLACALNEEANSQMHKLEADQEKRKSALAEVRKLQACQKAALKKAEGTKKLYYSKCKHADQIGQVLLGDMGRTSIQPKDIEKLKLKHTRCQQEAEQADVAYRDSLAGLEDIRQMWETETITASKLFQELEENRIKCLRDSFWLVGNLFSKQSVKEDDHQEQVRKAIESLDVNQVIKQFVKENQTGTQIPSSVNYEPYRSETEKTGPNKIMPKDENNEPIYAQIDKSTKKSKATEIKEQDEIPNKYYETEMELYDSIRAQEVYAWRVLKSYSANSSFEVSLSPEEYVQVTNQTDPDWWQIVASDGRKGYFPSKYLEYGAHIDVV